MTTVINSPTGGSVQPPLVNRMQLPSPGKGNTPALRYSSGGMSSEPTNIQHVDIAPKAAGLHQRLVMSIAGSFRAKKAPAELPRTSSAEEQEASPEALSAPTQPPRMSRSTRPNYPAAGKDARTCSDRHGDYIFCLGDLIGEDGRYEVRGSGFIGTGAFGVVVEAFDHRTERTVAIKLLKNREKFAQQAETEASILARLRHVSKVTGTDAHLVNFVEYFAWAGHECIVFERLGHSLYQVLSLSNFRGISLSIVRKFTVQLLESLAFLRRPDVNIIHCDLKPENVLLREPACCGEVALIDFGSSCLSHKQLHKYIQSRWYRAPEVIFGLRYGQEVDMWSLGCMLFELCCGNPLFPGGHRPLTTRSACHDMVLRFVRVLGPVPGPLVSNARQKLLRKSPTSAAATSSSGSKRASVDLNDEGFRSEMNMLASRRSPREELLTALGPNVTNRNSAAQRELFVDFLTTMLRFEPHTRIAPQAALSHPFLDNRHWAALDNRSSRWSAAE